MAKKVKKAKGLNINAVKKKAESLPSPGESSDITWWKPEEGKNKIRILPPADEALLAEGIFYKEAWYHYSVGPDNRALLCPKKMEGDDCFICEYIAKQKKKDNQDAVSDILPRARIFYNVFDKSDVEPNVKIYGSGIKIFKELIGYITDEDEDWGDITSLTEGRDINIEREGTGINTTYSIRVASKITDISEDADWDDLMYDLEEVFSNIPTYDETKAIFYGDDEEDEEEEDAKDIDDDEEDEEEDDVDYKREAKSSKKPKRTPKKSKKDDDDDDFLDDDDEEDDDF